MPSTRASKRKSDGADDSPEKRVKLTLQPEDNADKPIEKEDTETDRVLRTITYTAPVEEDDSVTGTDLKKYSTQNLTGLFDRNKQRKEKQTEKELLHKQRRSRSNQYV
jgi:hypothetical protein